MRTKLQVFSRRQRRSLQVALIATLAIALAVLTPVLKESGNLGVLPAVAQRARPQEAAPLLYKLLPDFPKENNYVNRETGKVDADNTLASRLMRYHIYVKGRPPNYRLDWKLTLADYLGANEPLENGVYPGHDFLKDNPMEGDRAAISRLNRAQRDALVNALVSIFNPKSEEPTAEPAPAASPTPQPEPEANPRQPPRGGADLLK